MAIITYMAPKLGDHHRLASVKRAQTFFYKPQVIHQKLSKYSLKCLGSNDTQTQEL